jgi:mannose-6-phosphate isomerase-like protein (cupin superfamily)
MHPKNPARIHFHLTVPASNMATMAFAYDVKSTDTGSLFGAQGFLAPVPVFTASQCQLILNHFRSATLRKPMAWPKGHAAADRFVYDVATRPALLHMLHQIIGPNVILWGASLVERDPGQLHIWHTDIESSYASGGFASIWIGLENTTASSSLKIISRSHRFGKPVQQVVREHGLRRGEASDATIEEWAREFDSDAILTQPPVSNGEAIVFDGRLWHASENSSALKRTALLLQYANADVPVFIPNFRSLEWPFRFTRKRPPTVIVSSKSAIARKDTVDPPSACPPHADNAVKVFIDPGTDYAEDAGSKWRAYPFFHGYTHNAEAMESHLSVLSTGHSPHPPHAHVEEELLLVLNGVGEILITDDDKSEGRVEVLHPGSFVYYPAYQHHTIRNRADGPVTYVMFKWQSRPLEVTSPMSARVFHMEDNFEYAGPDPMRMRAAFNSPTSYLKKLHAHETVLQPGAGYPAHADDHDVAIIVKSGKIRTAGREIGPRGIVFFPAGEMHGMHNPGTEPAHYLVFEFHGSNDNALTTPTRRGRLSEMRKLAFRAKNRLRGLKKSVAQHLKR